MDLSAEVDNLVKVSQTWIPMIMEYGSRVLLAVITPVSYTHLTLPTKRIV